MMKDLLVVPLYEKFIRDSFRGKRRKQNGQKILPRSVSNYFFPLRLLQEYEIYKGIKLRIKTGVRNNRRFIIQEHNYWKNFYQSFSDFLYNRKKYHDNYVGSVFKMIKCVFRYLKNEKFIWVNEYCHKFYVPSENIRIITLTPEQYCFLILDREFHDSLPDHLKRHKNTFVFGTIAALRYSDLMNIRVKDVEEQNGQQMLIYNSIKTGTPVSVKLPEFAVEIFRKYARRKKPLQKVFPQISLVNFNKAVKNIGARAGWTQTIGCTRCRAGRSEEVKMYGGRLFRFCDQMSSHTMRRTGITILLMLGLQEHLVRKVSGHSAHSKEFFRYVNLAQSYITEEVDKVHEKLLALYNK